MEKFFMSRFFVFLPILFLSAASIFAQTTNAHLLIGRVAVNKTHIAFTYAGKIWLVERTGGAARKLNDAGAETNPVFRPTGNRLRSRAGAAAISTFTFRRRLAAKRSV
jgi:tricorn protease